MDEEVASWERQSSETEKAWGAFQVYRDLGKNRTLAAACQALGMKEVYRRQLERWASAFSWKQRCRDYDNFVDRVQRTQREQRNRDEYSRKIEEYRDETERTGRAMINMGARAIAILQRELARRLETPENLRPNEMAALMRASCMAVDVGSRCVAEALGVDTLVTSLNDEKNERQI